MPPASKSERFEGRIAPEALEIIRKAAAIQGRSLSDFISAAAQEVARRTIEEEYIIRLSVEDQQHFAEMLINPPELSPALVRASEAHTRLIRESR
jgi:uncharacterized protein (DUF1778 family)